MQEGTSSIITTTVVTTNNENPKIIVCAGSTGVGKSALAFALAKFIKESGGEGLSFWKSASIINADVMQIYEGLPITTNKPSSSEMEQVKHYFVGEKPGVVSDRSELYTVLNFQKDCHDLFEKQLFLNGNVPIICGGTNYYIQSVIFDQYLIGKAEDSNGGQYNETKEDEEDVKNYTYERLKDIDPESAKLIHPNDIRKIKKRILLFENNQQVFTQVLESKQEQQKTLKYDCLFFYLACDNRGVLRKRIEDRAIQMMDNGLLNEVVQFHKYLIDNKEALSLSFEHGVLQSIGYKEFLPYLNYLEEINDLEDTNFNDETIVKRKEALKKQCLEALITGTFKYAKKQETWYRSSWASPKLPLVSNHNLYKFDISTFSSPSDIIESAKQIASHFLKGEEIPHHLQQLYCVTKPHEKNPNHPGDENRTYLCEKCGSTHVGYTEYKKHLKTRLHKKRKNPTTIDKLSQVTKHKKKDQGESSSTATETEEKNEDLPSLFNSTIVNTTTSTESNHHPTILVEQATSEPKE